MTQLRRILKNRWVIAISAALAFYTLTGFLLLPYLLRQFAPAIASERLHRTVTLGKVRFNPLLLKLTIDDFSLREAEGEPLATLGQLFVDFEVAGLLHRALAFREVRLERPFLRPVIGEDSRLNFAKIADAFPPSEEPSPDQAGLPRLLIDHLAVVDGVVEFTDRSHGEPVAERLEAINLKLDAVSTLPDNQASHHISASFEDGAVFDWHGEVSFNPLSSEGELRLDGFRLSTPWPFVQYRIAAEPPEGRLSFAATYRFRQDHDNIDLNLSEIGLTLGRLKLIPSGGKEPILAFDKIEVGHGSFHLSDQSIKIPEFTVQNGQINAAIDHSGGLDWQQLVKADTGPQGPANGGAAASSAQHPPTARPWLINIDALRLDDLSLKLTDASRRLPPDFSIGALSALLKLEMQAGAGDPKVSVDKFDSEIRNIALKPIGGKDPVLALESLQVNGGALNLANRNVKLPAVVIRKGSVRAEVDDTGQVNFQKLFDTTSTLDQSASSSGAVQRRTAKTGEQSQGSNPWHIEVDQLKIEEVGVGYVDESRKSPIQVDVASFGLGLRALVEAGAGEPKVAVNGLQSEIRQIVLRERLRDKPLASLASLGLVGGQIDLPKNSIAVQRITLGGGDTTIERDAKGVIRLAEVFAPRDEGKLVQAVREAETAAKAKGRPWQLAVDQADLNGFHAVFTDRGVTPPFNIELRAANFRFNNLSNGGKVPVAFDGNLKLTQGGELSIQGKSSPTGDHGQGEIRLDRLNLAGLQSYVARVAALRLESGDLSSRIKLEFQQRAGKMSLTAKGGVSSGNLMLKEAKSGKRFAEWQKLTFEGIDFSLLPDKLAIREIHAVKPGANFEIFEDRTTNVDAIFQTKKRSIPAPKARAGEEKRVAKKSFPFSVQRVKVDEAILDFSDVSLVLPFQTRIQNFGGTISGISTAPGARTLFKLDGRVDEYGEANLEGTLDLMQHNAFSDMTLIFRNVEMSSLSPYSGTFAGRRIQSGKLNAELQYRIDNNRLASHGNIELDQVVLGAEIVSPKAKSLPLDLALALLSDSSGKINVSIPVEGNVNDPQFAYGSVIWDAIVNVITKVATAPFTALASTFGGGEEDLGEIFFIAGKNGLPPAEIEKLKKVAHGLESRPNVVLNVEGTFDPQLDAEALKSWDVRKQVTQRLGITVLPGEDPGPVAFDSAKAQRALEILADQRGGEVKASALAAFRAKSGREPRRIGAFAAWMDKASEDASYYQLLFDRLVASAPLPPKALEDLADRRSQAIAKELAVHKGIGRNQVRIGKVATANEQDGRIPSRLDVAVGGS